MVVKIETRSRSDVFSTVIAYTMFSDSSGNKMELQLDNWEEGKARVFTIEDDTTLVVDGVLVTPPWVVK